MSYQRISDYGIIGNLYSVALVGLHGSIDWLCLPRIDSPSVFAALLDGRKGGRFSIFPEGERDSAAAYLDDTNVLVTTFRSHDGIMTLTDFMPVPFGGEVEPEEESHELFRLVEVTEGHVDVRTVVEPRLNYARGETSLKPLGSAVVAQNGEQSVTLSATRHLQPRDGRVKSSWRLRKGEKLWFRLTYGTSAEPALDAEQAQQALEATIRFWKEWVEHSEIDCTIALGPYRAMARRSALALKLLYYAPVGTFAAAATTSLPEAIGGQRNWDYRYTWLRDTALTLEALFRLGHKREMDGYLRWLERIVSDNGADKLQVMYGLRGETQLEEKELLHLDGYKGSRPVRVGNGAAHQRQLDIYGEVLDAALRLSDFQGEINAETWLDLHAIADYARVHWEEKDSGIWEVRGGPYHFVYSKVMCWVALDRALRIAERHDFPIDEQKFRHTRNLIKEDVLKRGWNEDKKAFVQHYETDELDASTLLLPVVGFLPYDDPRMVSTVTAVCRELSRDGFLLRYRAKDGLSGNEGCFLLCTCWLIRNLIGQGRLYEAQRYLCRVESVSNHLGLFAEEYDPQWREALGNLPQAFTHIGYINCVIALQQARAEIGNP